MNKDLLIQMVDARIPISVLGIDENVLSFLILMGIQLIIQIWGNITHIFVVATML